MQERKGPWFFTAFCVPCENHSYLGPVYHIDSYIFRNWKSGKEKERWNTGSSFGIYTKMWISSWSTIFKPEKYKCLDSDTNVWTVVIGLSLEHVGTAYWKIWDNLKLRKAQSIKFTWKEITNKIRQCCLKMDLNVLWKTLRILQFRDSKYYSSQVMCSLYKVKMSLSDSQWKTQLHSRHNIWYGPYFSTLLLLA